jgi:sec-independent protein translocase protein TatA
MHLPSGLELIIIAGVFVMLFGANKLPKLGGAIGESIKNFKKGIREGTEDETERKSIDSNSTTDKPKSND